MQTFPKLNKVRILLAIFLPLLVAAILDSSVTGTFAARIVGHMDWSSAINHNFEHFGRFWRSDLFFFVLRSASYTPLIFTSIIICNMQPQWFWSTLTIGLLIIISAEIYWTWDLVAIFYRPNVGHISSTVSLGYLVTPLFVGFTQLVCASVAVLIYYIKRIINHRNP